MFLIWKVEVEPCGFHSESKERKVKFYDEPNWYYISDNKIHCFGYASGPIRAAWNYLRNVPKTIALNRWYRDGRRET